VTAPAAGGPVGRPTAVAWEPPPSARELFERFAEHVDPARTRGEHATYRFDVEDVGSWLLEIDDGRVATREGRDGAACVIRIREDLLLGIARGEQNAASAFLTGAMTVEGDLSLAMKLEKFRPFRW
jgi:putative sterol carrier protein